MLEIEKPELAKEWHPTKNYPLTPDKINANSSKYAWWRGKCGHEWYSQIASRFRGCGCPYCANKTVLPGYNDLETKFPDVAKEWHPTKNGELKPSMVIAGSHRKVWWITSEGYEWEASIVKRIKGQKCPIYSNQKIVSGINDFKTLCPELMDEWDWEKNNIDPQNIGCAYDKKVWWKGKCGHTWETKIRYRVKGHGCPYCCGQKILKGYNDLATLNPLLASEWDSEKNRKSPSEYTVHSGIKVVWKCKKGHLWNATIASRTAGNGCPICNSEMQVSVPEKTIYYYICKNTNLIIKENYRFSDSSYELDIYIPEINLGIEYDGQAWHKDPVKDIRKNEYIFSKDITLLRIREPHCPRLNSTSVDYNLSSKYDSLEEAIVFIISYINLHYKKQYQIDVNIERDYSDILSNMKHAFWKNSIEALDVHLTKEWNYEKNLKLKPYDVPIKSGKRVWWKCSKCGYEWKALVADRSSGKGCPVCAGKVVLENYNDLLSLYPKIAEQWNYEKNMELLPNQVTPGSNKKVWWKCGRNHEWEAQISKRVQGGNCPYCTGRAVLIGFNDLATTNPELLIEWDYEKNFISPMEVSKGSHKKISWTCYKKHKWETTISSRLRGSGCPICQKENATHNCKQVVQFDIHTGKEIACYISQKQASNRTGISNKNISACCTGKRKEAGGYGWKFIE